MNEQRIQELFSDETFVKSLTEMDTPEQVQAAFQTKGVEVSTDDLIKTRDFILANINEDGELSLDALDNVAGGGVLLTKLIIGATKLMSNTIATTSAIGVPLGTLITHTISNIFRGW